MSGKQVPISDLLSRQQMSQTLDEYEGLDLHVHTVIKCLTFKDSRLEQLRVDKSRDSQMQTLKQTIETGWPETRQGSDNSIIEFFNHRDERSTGDGLIFRGQTILIPKQSRAELIEKVHVGHMGVDKTVSRAKYAFSDLG